MPNIGTVMNFIRTILDILPNLLLFLHLYIVDFRNMFIDFGPETNLAIAIGNNTFIPFNVDCINVIESFEIPASMSFKFTMSKFEGVTPICNKQFLNITHTVTLSYYIIF